LPLHNHALAGIAATVILAVAAGDAAAAVSAQTAWGGNFHPGRPTGVFVEVQSIAGGDAQITIVSGGQRYARTIRLEPGELHRHWLTVVPPAERALEVHVRAADGADHHEQLALRMAREPIVAYVSSGELRLPPDAGHTVVAVDPALLPDSADAFATLDALVLARSGFERLTESQISTLLGYLGTCGRLLAIDMPEATFRLLRAQAGCDGMFVAASGYPDALAATNQLLAIKHDALPSAARLAAMQPENQRMQLWWHVVIFVAGYVIVMVLLAISGRGQAALAATPLLAAVVALLVWTANSREELLIWSETYQGTQFARYRGLIRVTGAGRGTRRLAAPSGGGQPRPVTERTIAKFTAVAGRANQHSIEIPVSLMSRSLFLLEGTFPVNPALSVAGSKHRPAVIHRGAQPTPQGMLSMAGEIFPIPAMQPGQTIQINTDSPLPRNHRVGSILRLRAGTRDTLLLPLEQIDRLAAERASSVGWLMVTPRPSLDESG
jgi:hypothetical protein